MRRALQGCLSLALPALLAGCELVTGFGDFTVREPGAGGGGAGPTGPAPEALWSQRFGDEQRQEALGVAVSRALPGEGPAPVVVVGAFLGRIDLGLGAVESVGGQDAFVAKLDAAGDPLWSAAFGGTGVRGHFPDLDQSATSVAIDHDGGVLFAGRFNDTLDLGGPAPLVAKGKDEAFVAKLDGAGHHVWSRRLGTGAAIAGIAADSAGAVVLAGSFFGTIDLGAGPLTSAGNRDGFVAKLDAAGEHVWSRAFGDAYEQSADAVDVDPQSDDVVVTGEFLSRVDFGGATAPLTGTGGTHIFVVKLSREGDALWSEGYGASVGNPDLAIDDYGNVLLTGTFSETVDFGGGALPTAGGVDVFVAKLDLVGKHLWSRTFRGTKASCDLQDCRRTDLAIATDGASVVLTGAFHDALDLGGGVLKSDGGEEDVFAAKLDKEGETVWSGRFGDASAQVATAASCDRAGAVYITGRFEGAIDFGPGTLDSAGSLDAFLTKLAR